MRMPYQRMTMGPIWKAMAPGELMATASTPARISRASGRTDAYRSDLRAAAGASGAVLRKQDGPGIGVRVDDRDAPALTKADRTARTQDRDHVRLIYPSPKYIPSR